MALELSSRPARTRTDRSCAAPFKATLRHGSLAGGVTPRRPRSTAPAASGLPVSTRTRSTWDSLRTGATGHLDRRHQRRLTQVRLGRGGGRIPSPPLPEGERAGGATPSPRRGEGRGEGRAAPNTEPLKIQ